MTKEEILKMAAGPEMRQALIDSGLWDGSDIRDPSQDIAAAWEIVNKLGREPYAFVVENVNLSGARRIWAAIIWGGDKVQIDVTANAPTPALAICYAALIAVQKPGIKQIFNVLQME